MPLLVILAALATAAPTWAGQPDRAAVLAAPCAGCLVLVVPPTRIEALPGELHGLEVLVEATPDTTGLPRMGEAIQAKGGRPGLMVRGGGSPDDLVRVVVGPGTGTVVLDVRSWSVSDASALFALRRILTGLRAAAGAGVRFGVYPSPALGAVLERQAGGYWDFLVVSEPGPAASDAWKDGGAFQEARTALRVTRRGGAERWLVGLPDDSGAAVALVRDLARAAQWLTPDLIPAADVRISCGGRPLELFLHPVSLDLIALAEACGPDTPVTAPPAATVEQVRLSSGDVIVRVMQAAGERFASTVGVAATRRLTVDEIVARHQTAAARQSAALRTLIAAGTLTITFEAPGFPGPVTITSRTVIYRDGEVTDLEQRDVRVNGLAFAQSARPRLPIVEAERVAAPPLAITLGDSYRYRLAGEETRNGQPCHVVAFEPRQARGTLFRGRVWIAADDFGLVRIEAVQTGLRGPVVTSQQADDFVRLDGGLRVLARSEIDQMYEGAAHRTPIHRVLALSTQEVNAPDFRERRAAAYASQHTVLRDTPAGYRYLEESARKMAPVDAPATDPGDASARAGLAGTSASRLRTLAYGLIVDPNITRPLPFAGLSYVDFNLFGSGAQLNAFFGGTYGQAAFSVPSLGGSRWHLAGRAFGIASSYNDRMFDGGRERYDQNIRQRPAFVSAWLLRAVTPRVTLRAGYELTYTHFARIDATAADFAVPSAQAAHGLRLGLDAQRGGWDAALWWSGARRSGWRRWGPAGGEYDPRHADFQTFGGSVARSVIVSPRLVLRGEAAVMGGRDLDRFSRYAFGTFENRLRGYPAALIRYDRGGAVRTALAWSAARVVRLDAFGDLALVHDAGFGRGATPFTGVGAAIEAPAPFGMLVAAEWGYGVQGVNSSGRRGTQVVRVTGYRVF